MSEQGKLLLSMEGIRKSFPGVQALDDCQFQLYEGEVHALLGENGAGKSTLVKIIAGIYKRDAGTILYKGEPVNFSGTKEALSKGITMIHQELQLIPHLTAAQNIFIGREPRKGTRLLVDETKSNQQAAELIERLNLRVDPRKRVMDLSVAEQYMVEIARAVSYDTKLIIMDEPTAALTEAETQELFKIIRDMKAAGIGIIYISHRLEELRQIADRITVMRDGHYIGTKRMEEVSTDEIIRMMVGRTIFESAPEPFVPEGDTRSLEVRHLCRGSRVKDVSFYARPGEILGFFGLIGAGRTETARAIFGADQLEAGEVLVNGKKVHIRKTADAVKAGLGYLSEDRKLYGLTLGRDVESNILLASYQKIAKFGMFVDDKKGRSIAEQYVKKLSVATPSIKQLTKYLSGGNQQKVVIAKWLLRDCDILIFDEPTRGIDVGAKSEIYKLLNELAKQGKTIIVISSELPEILRLSHRIVVMCEGKITGELSCTEATQEKIMKFATVRDAQISETKGV